MPNPKPKTQISSPAILTVDGYVIGVYSSGAKAKAAWRAHVKQSKKDNPEFWPKGKDIFEHVRIEGPFTIDAEVQW